MDEMLSGPLVFRLPARKQAHSARPARHHRGSPVVRQCGTQRVNRVDRGSPRLQLQVCVIQGLEPVSLAVKTVVAELDEAWGGWTWQQVLLDWGLPFVVLAEPASEYDLQDGMPVA
jgi:hypothetical protein